MNLQELKELRKQGLTLEQIGKQYNVSRQAIWGKLNRNKVKVYQQTNKVKAYRKAYQQTDKAKAYYKAYYKTYQKTDAYKASLKAYRKTDKYKATLKAYQKTDKYKTYQEDRRRKNHKYGLIYRTLSVL